MGSTGFIPGLWTILAYIRLPGNAFAFAVRKLLKWSKGKPELDHEDKQNLFSFLTVPLEKHEAENLESLLREKFHLESLSTHSTAALYRKNLDLVHTLESIAETLSPRYFDAEAWKALDIGSLDWSYGFALERWLRFAGRSMGRHVRLEGIEIDAHQVFSNLHTYQDYALAYAAQTGNPNMNYRTGNFLEHQGGPYQIITHFFPIMTAHETLLWGLPLRQYAPKDMISHAFHLLDDDGLLITLHHSEREQKRFERFAQEISGFTQVSQGRAIPKLHHLRDHWQDRRYSVWKKDPCPKPVI